VAVSLEEGGMSADQSITRPGALYAATATLSFPKWFPEPLIDTARQVLAAVVESATEHDVALLARLIADNRMKTVWRELLRRRRTHQTITTYVNSWINHQVPGDMIDETRLQHASLEVLFVNIVCHLYDVLRHTEMAQIPPSHPKWRKWEESAAKLREEAAEVRGLGKDAIADRLLDAAMAYDDLVGIPTPFERMCNNAEARTLTLLVAADMIKLFGSPLYRTTATIVSVALELDITVDSVREWIKHPNLTSRIRPTL
jgi:hypothetical protein